MNIDKACDDAKDEGRGSGETGSKMVQLVKGSPHKTGDLSPIHVKLEERTDSMLLPSSLQKYAVTCVYSHILHAHRNYKYKSKYENTVVRRQLSWESVFCSSVRTRVWVPSTHRKAAHCGLCL